MEKELFSYSRLMTYKDCPKKYYYTYIQKRPRKTNTYGYIGSVIHSTLEELQKANINKEQAKSIFLDEIAKMDLIGLDFPTEKSKKNFIECMKDYYDNYTKIPAKDFYIEEYLEFKLGSINMRGYIDLYVIDGKYIDIYDYKSSSKFSAKDLKVKKMQLIAYAVALKEKYPDKEIRWIVFDMCKYTKNNKGTLKERNKESNTEKRGFLKFKVNEEDIEQTVKYLNNIYSDICMKIITGSDWEVGQKGFYCDNLCDHKDICPRG